MRERKAQVLAMFAAHWIAAPLCFFTLLASMVLFVRFGLGPPEDDDPGGPLVLPLLVAGGLILAAVMCLSFVVAAGGLQVLRYRLNVPAWAPLAAALPAAMVLFLPLPLFVNGGWRIWLLGAGGAAVFFAEYWLVLLAAEAIFRRIFQHGSDVRNA